MIKLLLIWLEYLPMIWWWWSYVDNLLSELVHKDIEIIHLTTWEVDSVIKVKYNLTQIRSKELQNIYLWEWNIINCLNVIIDVIREYSPNIVHTNHSIDGLLFEIINHRFSIPHVITNHRTPEHRKIISITKARTCTYDFVNKNNDKVYIVPSEVFKKEMLFTIDWWQNAIIHTVYPWIDRIKYHRASQVKIDNFRNELWIQKDDFVILLPIKIRRRKWLQFAVDCIKYSLEYHKNIKVIISWLPSDEEEALTYDYIVKEIWPNIIEHKYFDTDIMPLLFSSVDLTFLPSEAEWLWLALLEAASCWCPIIWSDVIWINEVIQDGYNWFLIEYWNTELFRNKLKLLIYKDPIAKTIINNWYSRLEKKFALKKQAQKHYDIYKNIVERDVKIVVNYILCLIEWKLSVYSSSKEKFILPEKQINYGKTIREDSIDLIKSEFTNQLEIFNPTINLWIFKQKIEHKNILIHALLYDLDSDMSNSKNEVKISWEWMPLDDIIDKIPKNIAKELRKYIKNFINKKRLWK